MADLQGQLLSMAVEKAALQRQVQQGQAAMLQLQAEVGGAAELAGAPAACSPVLLWRVCPFKCVSVVPVPPHTVQANKSQQMELAMQQMRADLQHASQLLEQTAGTSQQQAQINAHLQEHLQQVRSLTQAWPQRMHARCGSMPRLRHHVLCAGQSLHPPPAPT